LPSEAASSPVRALDPAPRTVGVHHKAPNHLLSLHPHAVTLSMPPAGTRARRRHLTMVIHHVMPPVRRRTASRLRRNLIQTNGSHLRSLNPRESITTGRLVSLPSRMTLRCLTRLITSCLGNRHTVRKSLNLATAPPAAVILITPSQTHQVHSVTALPRLRHLRYLILVMAQCPTQRCSFTSSRCSSSPSPETFPSFNSTMSPVACSMAPCRRCWQTA
jgi:hypothetical protein